MKKALCSLLAIAIVIAAVPLAAAEKATTVATATSAAPLQSAIKEAGTKVTLTAAAPAASSTASVPVSLPRAGSKRVRRQGMAMAVGLISTLAGVAGTVYMVKQLKKSTDETNR